MDAAWPSGGLPRRSGYGHTRLAGGVLARPRQLARRSSREPTVAPISAYARANTAEALQTLDNPTFAQPYNRYTSSLISPPIDCRGRNNIILQFTMFHNRLNGNAQISFFDGTSWSAPIIIATSNAINTSALPETVFYPLPQLNRPEPGQQNGVRIICKVQVHPRLIL